MAKKTYYYQENKGEFPNELPHLVMTTKSKEPVTSHLNKENTMLHIDNNNKRFPKGFTEKEKENINSFGRRR